MPSRAKHAVRATLAAKFVLVDELQPPAATTSRHQHTHTSAPAHCVLLEFSCMCIFRQGANVQAEQSLQHLRAVSITSHCERRRGCDVRPAGSFVQAAASTQRPAAGCVRSRAEPAPTIDSPASEPHRSIFRSRSTATSLPTSPGLHLASALPQHDAGGVVHALAMATAAAFRRCDAPLRHAPTAGDHLATFARASSLWGCRPRRSRRRTRRRWPSASDWPVLWVQGPHVWVG